MCGWWVFRFLGPLLSKILGPGSVVLDVTGLIRPEVRPEKNICNIHFLFDSYMKKMLRLISIEARIMAR